MPNPEQVKNKINSLAANWKQLAATISFGDTTLEDFNKTVAPSLAARAKIEELESQLKDASKVRDNVDRVSHAEYERIVKGILTHKQYGPNSGLYKALGYKTDDEKKSGLHRGSAALKSTAAK